MSTDVRFPYSLDGRGRTRQAQRKVDQDEYVRGLVELVLFTAPGERVMRPDFGSGLDQLLFAGNSPELAATTQMLVQSALQRWLNRLIELEDVEIEAVDSTLNVTVTYVVRSTGTREVQRFQRGQNS